MYKLKANVSVEQLSQLGFINGFDSFVRLSKNKKHAVVIWHDTNLIEEVAVKVTNFPYPDTVSYEKLKKNKLKTNIRDLIDLDLVDIK